MATDKAEVVMVLGGESYTFRWGTLAIQEMQELLSTPEHLVQPEEIFFELKRRRIKFMSAFIWAGLLKHQPTITLADSVEILDSAKEEEITTLLKEFGLSMTPDPADLKELKAGTKANPRKAQSKRGAGSTGETSTTKPAASA